MSAFPTTASRRLLQNDCLGGRTLSTDAQEYTLTFVALLMVSFLMVSLTLYAITHSLSSECTSHHAYVYRLEASVSLPHAPPFMVSLPHAPERHTRQHSHTMRHEAGYSHTDLTRFNASYSAPHQQQTPATPSPRRTPSHMSKHMLSLI